MKWLFVVHSPFPMCVVDCFRGSTEATEEKLEKKKLQKKDKHSWKLEKKISVCEKKLYKR